MLWGRWTHRGPDSSTFKKFLDSSYQLTRKLEPALKSWMDNVISPANVADFCLESMSAEAWNMKPSEPSRTALMVARQRAAHQVLDHGSILYDPFAMKILPEDEKEVLHFANGHPLASIG